MIREIIAFFVGLIIGILVLLLATQKPLLETAEKITENALITLSSLSLSQAEALVNTSWSDIQVPSCSPGEVVCPKLSVSVLQSQNGTTVFADIVGFADDSYMGSRRKAPAVFENGAWRLGTYTEHTLCRNAQEYPKGSICP